MKKLILATFLLLAGCTRGPVGAISSPGLPPTPSEWYGASAGTVKEGGALLYSMSCVNDNAYKVYIQLYNTTSAPVADAGAFLQPAECPASSTCIIGTDYFTANGIILGTGLSWGVSQVTQWYSAATAANVSCTLMFQ